MKKERISVAVLTHSASPYQVELFDALHGCGDVDLSVVYRVRTSQGRMWRIPSIHHRHVFVDESPSALLQARQLLRGCDLAVFGWYADTLSRGLISERAASRRAWCYWGERPGFHRWGIVGRLFRQLALRDLRRTTTAIWGIGVWAVDGWRREFGDSRPYFNVPYVSDLDRFRYPARVVRPPARRRVLFSGSLIYRKGVDLLARVFRDVSREFPQVSMTVVGAGELEAEVRAQLRDACGIVSFGGFCAWEALPSVYRDGDLLCAPSRYDGWGLIVPEGLASGLPVVATESMGSARELIVSGRNGWLVPSGDAGRLQRVMLEALTMPSEQFGRMSQAATESVAGYSLGAGVVRFLAACRETLSMANLAEVSSASE